jgi:hypothetical protein
MATVYLIFVGLLTLASSAPFPTSPAYNVSSILFDPTGEIVLSGKKEMQLLGGTQNDEMYMSAL